MNHANTSHIRAPGLDEKSEPPSGSENSCQPQVGTVALVDFQRKQKENKKQRQRRTVAWATNWHVAAVYADIVNFLFARAAASISLMFPEVQVILRR
jgi:hypothetical protein